LVASLRGFLHDFLRLLLGGNEEDLLALGNHATQEGDGVVDEVNGLGEVDDVDAVALIKDVRLHLGVPALGLVPEMQTCFDEVFKLESVSHELFFLLKRVPFNPLRTPAHADGRRRFLRLWGTLLRNAMRTTIPKPPPPPQPPFSLLPSRNLLPPPSAPCLF